MLGGVAERGARHPNRVLVEKIEEKGAVDALANLAQHWWGGGQEEGPRGPWRLPFGVIKGEDSPVLGALLGHRGDANREEIRPIAIR